MMEHASPKVLHLIASLAIGGTERQLVEFIRRSSDPDQHHVAMFYDFGPLADELPTPPIWLGRISRRPAEWAANLRTIGALRRTVSGGRFDLVHAHLGLSEILAAIATPRGVPVVASRRGRNVGFDANVGLRLLEGLGHRRTSVLICNAAILADEVRRDERWPPPTRVIPNGIDTDGYEVPPFPDGPPTVVVVANLHRYKGHDRFLRAFAGVRGRIPHARAILVGEGVERPRLEALVRELGLVDEVTFTGQVPDPRPYIAEAHVVALTSDHEGFPNALLESMAMGRPVVATRVGGIPELVRDGRDGLLVSPEVGSIEGGLLSVLLDAGVHDRLGAAARARAETFAWDRVVRQTEDVYREVLGRGADIAGGRSRR